MLPLEVDAGTKATLLQTLLPGLLPAVEKLSYDSVLTALSATKEEGDEAPDINNSRLEK